MKSTIVLRKIQPKRLTHYPKFFYELLPYLYFISGIFLIHAKLHFIFSIVGSLLFIFGSALWIIRSNHRRQDKQGNKSASTLLSGFSQKSYELRPFICVLIALLSSKYIDINWIKGPAIVLLIIAFWILTLRITNRHFSENESKKFNAL